jgi:hypothetical protein
MARESMGKLLDRWVADANFRSAIRRDPEAAIKQAGIELDTDTLAAVRNIDWTLPDEELQARVSKH